MREYIYIISWEKILLKQDIVIVKEKIVVEKLEKIFSDFIGVHNFKNFRLSDCVSKVTIREIYQIEVKYFEENKIKIYIKGSAFLKSQVRIMVGIALEIYYGKLPENHIKVMLTDFTREYKKILLKQKGFIWIKLNIRIEKIKVLYWKYTNFNLFYIKKYKNNWWKYKEYVV